MKKRGSKLAILGVLVGLLIGLGVIGAERYLARQVILLLEDEVSASCDCTFETDSISVSLPLLKAVAENVRIVSEGENKLFFRKVDVRVSPRKIFEKVVVLSSINLIDGYAKGVGPRTATFEFIDHLSTPTPPDKIRPGRWKALLEKLTVSDSKLSEHFTASTLYGDGVNATLVRDENDTFLLHPLIKDLRLEIFNKESGETTNTFYLGTVTSVVRLLDDSIEYEKIALANNNGRFEVGAISDSTDNNALSGSLSYSIFAPYLQFDSWLKSNLVGDTELSGLLESPKLSGDIKSPPNNKSDIRLGNIPLFSLDSVSGKVAFDFNDGPYVFELQNLKGKSKNASVRAIKTLRIDNDKLSGRFNVKIATVESDGMSAKKVKFTVSLDGTIGNPIVSAKGNAGTFMFDGYGVRDLSFQASTQNSTTDLTLKHKSKSNGSLKASGQFKSDQQETKIQEFDYSFKNFKFIESEGNNTFLGQLKFTGDGEISGPSEISDFKGDASLTVSSRHFEGEAALNGDASIRNGVLKVDVVNKSASVKTVLSLDLTGNSESSVFVKLVDFDPSEYNPNLECVNLSLATDYSFLWADPRRGNGNIEIDKFKFGCEPYTVSLPTRENIKIKDGSMKIDDLLFSGKDSSVQLGGFVSLPDGVDLRSFGSLKLNALLGFFPTLDDLRGHLTASFKLKGPIDSPRLEGEAKVKDGEFAIASTNVSAQSIEGSILFKEGYFKITDASGSLNGGAVSLHGSVYPLNLNDSNLSLKMLDVLVEPDENTNIVLSGDLLLAANEGEEPTVVGELTIDSGEFQKEFGLKTVLDLLSNQFFQKESAKSLAGDLPSIGLAVNVKATRNFFIISNFVEAELRADLAISGTLNSPNVNGSMETLTGWVGLRKWRFDITSGHILFNEDYIAPRLEILGETLVRSQSGEIVLVFLEVSGPLSSPKITLSTDSGLTHQDTLTLLTSRGYIVSPGNRTLVNDKIRRLKDNRNLLLGEDFTFSDFFLNLAAIDDLSIEPSVDIESGLVVPNLIAQKYITDRISISGETLLGATDDQSKIGLLYKVTPRVNLSGGAVSRSSEQNTAFTADLTYTVLSEKKQFLNIIINGNDSFSNQAILSTIRINESSRVPESETAAIEKSIRDYYQERGYFQTEVQLECLNFGEFCGEIVLLISEGAPSLVEDIILEGNSIPEKLRKEIFNSIEDDEKATEQLRAKTRDKLIRSLRAEGYIGARVEASYSAGTSDSTQILTLEIKTGKPVSFSFNGNSEFSAEDFLETINLFSRKQPFGNNTINILIENIERLYREQGFLYATIKYSRKIDKETGRVNFIINIIEEGRVVVSEVVFKGSDIFTPDQLLNEVILNYPDYTNLIFEPQFAVAEQLLDNAEVLRAIYVEAGYVSATVTPNIISDGDIDELRVEYQIVDGKEAKASKIDIVDFPEGIDLPAIPEAPYSIPKTNRYIDRLQEVLHTQGYISSELWSEIDSKTDGLIVHIEAGNPTRIQSILIDGNLNIQRKVIKDALTITPGDRWSTTLLSESKRNILKLGLFERVDLSPLDGKVDEESEVLVIRVSERALRTLEIGGGINTELGFHVFGEGTDKKIFGDGRSLSLRLDNYYDPTENGFSQGIANLRYADPTFFDSSYSFTEDLRFQKLDLDTQEFDLDRVLLASLFQRSWDFGFTHSVGHTILQENLDNVSSDAILSDLDTGTNVLSFLSGTATFDQRDNPLNPKSGYSIALDYQISADAIASDANFYSIGGKFSFIQSVVPDFISIASRSRIAGSWTFSDTTDVPITQRFYLGGTNTIRGFRENSLGPRGPEGSVIGGDLLVAQNFEFRYHFAENLSLHTFFDAGTVYLKDRPVLFSDIRKSIGFGFRYSSPFGPIGFDFGKPLDEKEGEPSSRFHLAIGTFF